MTHPGRPGVPVQGNGADLAPLHIHSCLFCHRDYDCRMPHASDGERMRVNIAACHHRGHRCCFGCWAMNVRWVRRLRVLPAFVAHPNSLH